MSTPDVGEHLPSLRIFDVCVRNIGGDFAGLGYTLSRIMKTLASRV